MPTQLRQYTSQQPQHCHSCTESDHTAIWEGHFSGNTTAHSEDKQEHSNISTLDCVLHNFTQHSSHSGEAESCTWVIFSSAQLLEDLSRLALAKPSFYHDTRTGLPSTPSAMGRNAIATHAWNQTTQRPGKATSVGTQLHTQRIRENIATSAPWTVSFTTLRSIAVTVGKPMGNSLFCTCINTSCIDNLPVTPSAGDE